MHLTTPVGIPHTRENVLRPQQEKEIKMAGCPPAVEASSKHQSIADSVPDGPVLRISSFQQNILIRAGWMNLFCLAALGARQAGFHSATTSSMHPPSFRIRRLSLAWKTNCPAPYGNFRPARWSYELTPLLELELMASACGGGDAFTDSLSRPAAPPPSLIRDAARAVVIGENKWFLLYSDSRKVSWHGICGILAGCLGGSHTPGFCRWRAVTSCTSNRE